MKSFSDMGQKAAELLDQILYKTSEQVELLKLRIAIRREEDKKIHRLQEMGSLVCKRYAEGESFGEQFDFIYGEIEMIDDSIIELRKQLHVKTRKEQED